MPFVTATVEIQDRQVFLAITTALVVGAAILAPGPGPGAWAQTGPAVARVATLQGTATVEHFGSPQQTALAVQSPLHRADTVHTRAGSKVRIAFDDETVITLGELASLRITQIAEPAPGRAATSRLTVLAGTARFVVKPASGRAAVEMWTPTAIAAVRGTEYIAEVTAGATAVLVVEGAVAVSNLRPDVRGTVVLQAGQGTTVRADRAPQPPARWGDARRRAVEEATRLP